MARVDPPLVVSAVTGTPDSTWDQAVAALGGCAFHSRGYGLACRDLGSVAPFLVFRREGREVGYAVALTARTRWRPLGWARDILELSSPPALSPAVTRAQAVDALIRFARENNFGHLRIDSFGDPRPDDPLPGETPRIRRDPRLEYRVPIGPDFAATLARMSSTHRRKIRKALEGGFVFEEQTSIEGALRLYAAHEQTFERHRARGEGHAHAWRIEDFRRRMEAYLHHGMIRFHFTVLNGQTLSAIGTMQFGQTAYYLVGGTTPDGIERQTGFAMFANTIQRLITEGVTEFNLGGTSFQAREEGSSDHGLFRYKSGYGAKVLELTHLSARITPWRWWPAIQG